VADPSAKIKNLAMAGQQVTAEIHECDKWLPAHLARKEKVIPIMSFEGGTGPQVLTALPAMKDICAQVCPPVHLFHMPRQEAHSFGAQRTRGHKVGRKKMEYF